MDHFLSHHAGLDWAHDTEHATATARTRLGGTGKVGRRIVARLTHRGVPVRMGARTAAPAFDWNDPATWRKVLHGVQNVFISYAPDIAVPGAPQAVAEFTQQAAAQGVARVVLLSGRG